jgi:ABC-type branched-subunit amino acid transport system ATPase component
VIELLGVGVPRREGGWLLHRVCATLETGEVTVVLGGRAEERLALLDTLAGRRLPEEGRVWVGRVPLMRATVSRIRGLAAEVDPDAGVAERRSLFWNVLAPAPGPRALGRLLRLPRWGQRHAAMAALERVGLRARAEEPAGTLTAGDRVALLVARALARRPRYLVVREADRVVGPEVVEGLLALLRRLARAERLGIVMSLAAAAEGLGGADRVLLLGDGLLLFQGRATAIPETSAARRAGRLAR